VLVLIEKFKDCSEGIPFGKRFKDYKKLIISFLISNLLKLALELEPQLLSG